MKGKRTRRRHKKGGNTPPNKTRSFKPPLGRPLLFLNSLHTLSDEKLISMFEIFEKNNGSIMIESNNYSPLNVSPFYKHGIASGSIKNIKGMKINPEEKIKDTNKRDFIINAFINELIKRKLINNDEDST